MITRYWLTGIVAITLLTTIGSAQQPSPNERFAITNVGGSADKSDTATIYEDIEVMRRLLGAKLLGRNVASAGGPAGSLWYYGDYVGASNNWRGYSPSRAPVYDDGRHTALSLEGVYLQGKGLIFTMVMPATQRDPLPTASTSTAKSVNEWERTRQQMRGERPDNTTKAEPPAPSTADLILSVIAENGKHVRLKDNEDVTVVVTFRGGAVPQGAYPMLAYERLMNASGQTVAPQGATPGNDPAGHGKSARDFFLLGDLHLRQQQYDQAKEALQKAIDLEPNGDPKQLAETFRKLAETKLHLGQLDEAKAMIESAVAWEKKSKDKVANTFATELAGATSHGPSKLIITASKRQLDDVGSGKMSAEEFRKAIRIEMVTVPNFK